MYNGKKILAFIPARFGSKGIPHKNLKEIGGKPLFMHSVHCAFESKYVDDVLVSSDSPEILRIAHEAGCIENELRPAELSGDKARTIDGLLWEIQQQKTQYDAVVVLQPTYPIRPDNIVDATLEKYFETETSLITIAKLHECPEFIRCIKDGKLKKIMTASADIRRQDFPEYYRIIGSVYINNVHTMTADSVLNENEIPYLLDDAYKLDIDTEADWKELESRQAELKR